MMSAPAPNRRQRLQHRPRLVDPAVARVGFQHRVLAADVIRRGRDAELRLHTLNHIEIRHRRLDHPDVRTFPHSTYRRGSNGRGDPLRDIRAAVGPETQMRGNPLRDMTEQADRTMVFLRRTCMKTVKCVRRRRPTFRESQVAADKRCI